MKLDKLNNYYQDLNSITKSSDFYYEYEYFDIINKDGYETILYSEEINKKYSNSRKGYEDFKRDHSNFRIGYSGEVSVRDIKNYDTNDKIGYIFERKIIDKSYSDKLNVLYNYMKEEVISLLKIKDIESFEYFLKTFNVSFEFNIHSNIKYEIKKLYELVTEYNEDEDFKKFFDKIVK